MSFRLALLALAQGAFCAVAAASAVELVVSVPEQKLYVFDDAGEKVASYRVSTSARGLGDGRGTYATPPGMMEVAAKVGDGAPIGAVFKAGRRTGEICKPNAKGRDPIVTRILHLRGMESRNAHAYGRCIYIHGTPDERHLGKPVSYGCIRMSSTDVVELFNLVGVGTKIEVTQDRVTSMFGTIVRRPVRLQAIASATTQTPVVATAAVSAKNTSASAKLGEFPRASQSYAALSKPASPARETKADRASGNHLRLLETSGLTINFAGAGAGEDSDRPRH